ncbi:MAG: EutN/CcmL family microcompartment protein, partial [Planctomycetota bacterium]
MILADVIGTVVSPSEQMPVLDGRKLLVVRPVRPTDGAQAQAAPRVAIDTIGAGVGDRVLERGPGEGKQGAACRDLVDACGGQGPTCLCQHHCGE